MDFDSARFCLDRTGGNSLRFRWSEVDSVDPDRRGVESRVSHYAFGQLCRTFGAPASYLRDLPVQLAVDCLEEGRQRWIDGGDRDRQQRRHTLFSGDEGGETSVLRAATSDRYVRVWNDEIVERLIDLQGAGWRVPLARPSGRVDPTRFRTATEEDIIDYGHESALTVKVGDQIAPAGLYASDHDMFAFMIHPEVVIEDGLSPQGLRRGTMVRQSEVGDCAIWKLDFLFNTVCGNHIVWGAQDVSETRVRHTGATVGERWTAMVRDLTEYSEDSARQQEAKIREAQSFKLGDDRDAVIDFLYGKRIIGKRACGAALDLAEEFESVHGDPLSAWGVVQGITRLSQATPFADKRSKLDRKAGKILAEVVSLN